MWVHSQAVAHQNTDQNTTKDNAQKHAKFWVDSDHFNIIMAAIVTINSITIGFETDSGVETAQVFAVFNDFFLVIYISELGCRFFYHGLSTLNDGFNNFDLMLVSISVFERVFFAGGTTKMLPILRVIRIARLVRLVRLLRFFRELWLVVSGIARALATLGWIGFLLMCLIWVCAIFSQMVVGQSTAWLDTVGAEDTLPIFMPFNNYEYFGTVARSAFTLFQISTMSQWAQHVVRPIMEKYPIVVLFFIFYLFMTAYGLLNVIVANLVNDAIVSSHFNDQAVEGLIREEREARCKKIEAFFQSTDTDGDGRLTEDELGRALKNPKLRAQFQLLDVPNVSPGELIQAFDKNGNGVVTHQEFAEGILKMRGDTGNRDMVLLQMEIEGITARVMNLEHRLDKLYKQVKSIRHALTFALEGVRNAYKKADSVEMRTRQLKILQQGDAAGLSFLDEAQEEAPEGELELLMSTFRKLFGPDANDSSAEKRKWLTGTSSSGPDHTTHSEPVRSHVASHVVESPSRTMLSPSKTMLPDAPQPRSKSRRGQQQPAGSRQARPLPPHHGMVLRQILNDPPEPMM